MRRRIVLIVTATLLGFANLVYFASSMTREGSEELKATWVALMPELEAYQRRNPENILRNSHVNDSRYPNLLVREDESWLPVFPKIAGECRVSTYSIRSYDQYPGQMPDRFFLGGLTTIQQECVSDRLPEGYQLVRLKTPTKPSQLSWARDLSSTPQSEALNAQTH